MEDLVINGPDINSSPWLPPNIPVGNFLYTILKERNGDDVILIDGSTNETLTYKDILEKTIKLANSLRQSGVKKDDIITIISENNLYFILTAISCSYIGAICYPVNQGYSPREIKHALDITKPKLAFISESACESFNKVNNELEYLEKVILFGETNDNETKVSFHDFIAEGEQTTETFKFEAVDVKNQSLFILSSSGTTGVPKSVVITHENFRLASVYIRDPSFMGLSKEEKLILVLPLFHIFGLFIAIGSILCDSQMIILQKFKPDVFLKTIQDHQITKLCIVPTLAVFLTKSPIVDGYNLSCIKDIVCGAAHLGSEVQIALQNKFKVKVRQLYGMSETCGAITISCQNKEGVEGSVGELVPGISVKIVDLKTGDKVGPNIVGELCSKSDLNFKGYFNDEVATKHIFDDEGFLHTGDIGYYNENHHFYIVDRLKDLIKYKGFQVPPTELENILLSHEAIKEAAVIGIPDEKAGELPLAFVIRQQGSTITEEEIKSFVAEFVSVQKQLHGGVRFIDEIPKAASGKILRRMLRDLVKS